MIKTKKQKTARIFARAYMLTFSTQFSSRLLSTVPIARSSTSCSGGKDAATSESPSRSTNPDHHLAS